MLKHLVGFQRKRDSEVAHRLWAWRSLIVPTLRADKGVHHLGEFIECHCHKVLPISVIGWQGLIVTCDSYGVGVTVGNFEASKEPSSAIPAIISLLTLMMAPVCRSLTSTLSEYSKIRLKGLVRRGLLSSGKRCQTCGLMSSLNISAMTVFLVDSDVRTSFRELGLSAVINPSRKTITPQNRVVVKA